MDPFGSGPFTERAGSSLMSQWAMGHSCFTACVQPALAGSLQCSTKERVKPSISHSHSPAPELELHWDCHSAVLLQEKISCDKPHSLIVVDDVTCNWNGEGT